MGTIHSKPIQKITSCFVSRPAGRRVQRGGRRRRRRRRRIFGRGGGRRGRERRGQRQHEQTVIVRRNRGKKTAALHAEELGNSTQNGVTKRAHDVHHARRFKSYGRRGRGDWMSAEAKAFLSMK